jgi:putative FmdB family regulatory protein
MIYPYQCKSCGPFEVVKSVKDIDNPEQCPTCYIITTDRRIGLTRLGDVDMQPAWNPAIGKFIKSKSHLREELSRLKGAGHDMIEVGDESPDKIHKHFDEGRKQKLEDSWEPAEKALHDWRNGK